MCAFGEGALQKGIGNQRGQPVLANVLGLTAITPGAIAGAAILVSTFILGVF